MKCCCWMGMPDMAIELMSWAGVGVVFGGCWYFCLLVGFWFWYAARRAGLMAPPVPGA